MRVRVSGIPATDTTARFNGELMRGFGLAYDGDESFATTQPVVLGGVAIEPRGQGQQGRQLHALAGHVRQHVAAHDHGRRRLRRHRGPEHRHQPEQGRRQLERRHADRRRRHVGRGRQPVRGRRQRARPVARSSTARQDGHRQLPARPVRQRAAGRPGWRPTSTATRTRSRSRRARRSRCCATSSPAAPRPPRPPAQQVAAVKTGATTLAATPDLAGIPAGARLHASPTGRRCSTPPPAPPPPLRRSRPSSRPSWPSTTSGYDVFDKSITQLEADMKSGLTTSQEITRAYLDRIAAYDSGPFGFHAFITVADDAMAQAKAADDARAAGDTSELLGIPVAIKDLYDTKDMPTTDGVARVRGLAAEARRVPGQAPARRGRDDPRQGQPVRVRQLRLLQRLRLRHGLERVQAVQDLARLLRRLRRRRPRSSFAGVRHGHADRRLAVRAVDRRVAGLAARHRRHLLRRGRDAADLAAGLRGPDRPHDAATSPASSTSPPAPTRTTSRPSTPTPTPSARPTGRRRWTRTRCRARRSATCRARSTPRRATARSDGTVDALKARFADIVAAGATMVPITAAAPSAPVDRHARPAAAPRRAGSATSTCTTTRRTTRPSEILSSPKVLPYNRGTQNPRRRG